MIATALRAVRTVALRFASPLERLWRRASGLSELPPLWLRRHTGPVRAYERAAVGMAEFLDRFGLLPPEPVVLDAGCGTGAMVAHVRERLGASGRYVGFDVHAQSIAWCRKRYRDDARLEFHLAGICSPWGSSAAPAIESYRFPIEDGEADLVIAKSLMTHLLEAESRHYLREIRRSLRPGRAAVVTALLFEPAASDLAPVRGAFPFSDSSGGVRWRSRARPESAVAYAKPLFVEMVETAGLHVQWHWRGYYPGAARLTGQDVLLIGH